MPPTPGGYSERRVEPRIWMAGLALIALGLAWHVFARRRTAVR